MANFKESFTRGLEAAAEASARIAEIDSVFEDMNLQVSEITGGKVNLERETRYKSPLGVIGQTLALAGEPFKREQVTYIVATNPLSDGYSSFDVALWVGDSRGYPCKVSFGGQSFLCEDKAALEAVLSQMLAWPETGKIFQKLISLPSAS